MGTKYNTVYKRGKYNTSKKAWLADKAKFNSQTLAYTSKNRDIWLKDTRKYDLYGVDTPPTKGQKIFKYKYRSELKTGKKLGRENKRYRRYWMGRKTIRRK